MDGSQTQMKKRCMGFLVVTKHTAKTTLGRKGWLTVEDRSPPWEGRRGIRRSTVVRLELLKVLQPAKRVLPFGTLFTSSHKVFNMNSTQSGCTKLKRKWKRAKRETHWKAGNEGKELTVHQRQSKIAWALGPAHIWQRESHTSQASPSCPSSSLDPVSTTVRANVSPPQPASADSLPTAQRNKMYVYLAFY